MAPLGWHTVNPALLVAERLGFAEGDQPAELMVSAIGGNAPQAMMHDACRAIGRGDLDVVLVTGAEAMYARALGPPRPGAAPGSHGRASPRERPRPSSSAWTGRAPPTSRCTGAWSSPSTPTRLFENALRAANGWTLDEHAARIGALWSRFSDVAAGNPVRLDPHGRARRTRSSTLGPDNRMVSFPYPKLCTANMQVDQGAGYIVCSVEAARAAGVPEERWVFPLAGADANDHWFISQRPELHRSPAIRLAGPPPSSWPASASTTWRGSTSTRASPPWCRWRPPSWAWPSTTRTGR